MCTQNIARKPLLRLQTAREGEDDHTCEPRLYFHLFPSSAGFP
jgi:hypothetical protein